MVELVQVPTDDTAGRLRKAFKLLLKAAQIPTQDSDEEVVIAYEVMSGGERRMHLTVLSFRDVEPVVDPDEYTGPASPTLMADVTLNEDHPADAPTYNIGLLHHQDGTRNQMRIDIGLILAGSWTYLVVAHATPNDELVVMPYSLESLASGSPQGQWQSARPVHRSRHLQPNA